MFSGRYPKMFSRDTILRTYGLAKQAGCKFTIGSDSHELGRHIGYGEAVMFCNEVGITEADFSRAHVLNKKRCF